jgi:hypothetical protein
MYRGTAKLADRRKACRYIVQVHVLFSWEGLPGPSFHGEGITRDVSVAGVYVYTQTRPPMNAVLHTEILLPKASGRGDIRAECEMRVQRVEQQDLRGSRRSGFAGEASRLKIPMSSDSP